MNSFPKLDLTVRQLEDLLELYLASNRPCLCFEIVFHGGYNFNPHLIAIRDTLGGSRVRLDEYMFGRLLDYDDARQLRIDWLNHEIARQKEPKIPSVPEGFEYLGRGPVKLPRDGRTLAGYSELIPEQGWKFNHYTEGYSPTIHYAVGAKPKKLGPWHVKDTFSIGDKFEYCGSTYILAVVGPDPHSLFYQLVNIKSGSRFTDKTIAEDSGCPTAQQIDEMLGIYSHEFTYVEK